MLEPGDQAPPFTLPDPSGKQVSLKDFPGRNVILYFYPRDDTPGCTKEACGFRDAWTDLQDFGVVVLGVSADDAASHTKFAAKYRLPFTLLSDPDHMVMTAFGATGLGWPTPPSTRTRSWPPSARRSDRMSRYT